jgi:hypothetical protein
MTTWRSAGALRDIPAGEGCKMNVKRSEVSPARETSRRCTHDAPETTLVWWAGVVAAARAAHRLETYLMPPSQTFLGANEPAQREVELPHASDGAGFV